MIYLVDLEYVETRYTAQWKTELPQQIADATAQNITVIEGPADVAGTPTPGAFLDFGGTNIYKSAQTAQISQHIQKGEIKDGDHFVFADAWHPGIINLKYMLDLLEIDAKIHALWHAGSYDPHDFLGRLIGDKPWVRYTELALFDAIDKNYFASQFHIELFVGTFFGPNDEEYIRNKIVRTGWPMEYLNRHIDATPIKDNIILFPHRNAPEKQLDIFLDLQKQLPQYKFINCNDYNLTKSEYNKLLQQSKMVFSANLQETLGIGCYEILMAGGIPLVPNRLSYKEMYDDIFKYPTALTSSFESYEQNKDMLIGKIETLMENFMALEVQEAIKNNKEKLETQYFTGTNLYQELQNEKI